MSNRKEGQYYSDAYKNAASNAGRSIKYQTDLEDTLLAKSMYTVADEENTRQINYGSGSKIDTNAEILGNSSIYNQKLQDDVTYGSNAIFNKYVLFRFSGVESNIKSESYDITKHFDISPSDSLAEATFQSYTSIPEENVDMRNDAYKDDTFSNNKIGFNNIKLPTAKNIIDYVKNNATNLEETSASTTICTDRLPYSWSDFIYCKYYGKVPNSNMITLRRFGQAVMDNAGNEYDEPLLPVAQAVTYFGEGTGNKISEILKMNYSYVWTKLTSSVNDVDGNEKGFGMGLEGLFSGLKDSAWLQTFIAAARISSNDKRESDAAAMQYNGGLAVENEYQRKAYGDSGTYWDQVYGPVNVINETHKRDRGLLFTNDIKLKFSYCLRMIDGVNPKIAMLDILVNFLRLTYSTARFWGGLNRYYPDTTSLALQSGDLSTLNDPDKGSEKYLESEEKTWDGEGIAGNVLASIYRGANGFFSQFESSSQSSETSGTDNSESLIEKIIKKEFLNKDGMNKEEFKKVMNNIVSGALLRNNRPARLAIKNMLSGKPIGEWHLVVGSPFQPIVTIGNLILKDSSIDFNDTLGIDGFPTEMNFSVTLAHARPRDISDIESMFNLGLGKMSYSPITSLPSEMNTHGEAWGQTEGDVKNAANSKEELSSNPNGHVSNLSNEDNYGSFSQAYSNTHQSMKSAKESGVATYDGETYKIVKQRISSDWGDKYASATNLAFLLQTKLNM